MRDEGARPLGVAVTPGTLARQGIAAFPCVPPQSSLCLAESDDCSLRGVLIGSNRGSSRQGTRARVVALDAPSLTMFGEIPDLATPQHQHYLKTPR